MLLVSAVVHPLFAQAPAAPGGNALMQFLPIIFIFAAMYFFMIAPQRKKQKEHQKMLQSLSPGDEIVTTGGVYGTVTGVKDDRFIVRVADATKIELGKSFVHAVVKKADNTSAAK
ncbi:MAG: preprotein translocase subunit YajC [Opitutaceae bacterium]|nr:preprotein translocase subunit YajC [Opitutaceae bacterium]